MPAASAVASPPRPPVAPVAVRTAVALPPGNGLGFGLFLLVNMALFVRPADVVPDLLGVEIYQYLILLCLAVSFPAVLAQLSPSNFEARPIDLCVLALLPAAVLSHLTHAEFAGLADSGILFLKIVIYYLLFVSLVTTPARLRLFLSSLILCAAVVAVLSAMDYHQVIEIPRPPEQIKLMELALKSGEARMYGPGIFGDPNDVCILIVTALILLIGKLADSRAGAGRWLWLLPMGVFVYGFYLTRSRGGLLALLAGLGLAVRLRYGWTRAILLAGLGLPVLLFAVGGRQTAISASTNTGQERIQLWNEGMVMFRANPLFGVGMGLYKDNAGQVAHNSYMQAFGELGLFGGTFFLGACYLSLWGLYRLARPVPASGTATGNAPLMEPLILDDDLRQLHPYLTGAVTAYCGGMMTLTLNTLPTTYTMFALASTFLVLAVTRPAVPGQRFDGSLVVRLVGMSLLFLAGMFAFIRLTFHP